MSAVTEDIKLFIVQRLAVFDTQVQVMAAVKEMFGVEVSRQQVYFYDPTVGKKPAQKWIKEFRRTRRLFLKRSNDIAIANKSVRLKTLGRIAAFAEEKKNFPIVLQTLEQAAKEMGGAFTNRSELTGKNGAPLIPANDPLDDMTPEELVNHAQALAKKVAK